MNRHGRLLFDWIPACAGMTVSGAGMTVSGTGMAVSETGMMVSDFAALNSFFPHAFQVAI
jgi:hypothetical protein